VLITLFLTTVGILALLSMQPTAWQAAGRSDFMGRAADILQSEFEKNELQIMNPNNAVSTGASPNRNVYASSQSTKQSGDLTYTIATKVTPVAGTTNAWSVQVQVTWPGNARGVSEVMTVTRQEYFRQ
jgi:Tfp pilus assembly protein PilV